MIEVVQTYAENAPVIQIVADEAGGAVAARSAAVAAAASAVLAAASEAAAGLSEGAAQSALTLATAQADIATTGANTATDAAAGALISTTSALTHSQEAGPTQEAKVLAFIYAGPATPRPQTRLGHLPCSRSWCGA